MGVITNRSKGGGGGGSGGVEKLVVGTDEFTGPVAFYGVDGVSVALDDASSIAFGLNAATTIRSIKKFGETSIFGDVALVEGNGVSLGQFDQTITVSASVFRANASGYVSGNITFADSASVTVSESGGTFSFTGYALPTHFTIAEVGNVMLLRRSNASAARQMRFENYSSDADANEAYSSIIDFAFTNETGGSVVTLALSSYRAFFTGTIEQRSSTQQSVAWVDPAEVDTSSTTATQIGAFQPPVNRCVTATVTLQHDNGTTCGRTVYTHTFRRGASGAPVPQGSAEDLSVAAKKLGHGVTFTIVSGQINVNVVAASATPTKHRGQVAWEVGDIS